MYNPKESWTDEDTSLTYLGNLTGLIREVRSEMFDASEAGTWQCAEHIPVVIVQIGYWYVCMNYTSSYLHLLCTYCEEVLQSLISLSLCTSLAGHREIGPSAFEMLKQSTVRKTQGLKWWYQMILVDIITTMQPPC